MDVGRSLEGKVAIVTGGSSGIGKYTALGLAKAGARVVITARSEARLAETAAWITAAVPGAAVETETVDFASFASVRALADRILTRHQKIAVLADNAGMVAGRRSITEDGHELLLQVNHLSPFLLTLRLLPAVEAESSPRIVIVASAASQRAVLDFADLEMDRGWGPMRAYGRSKLCNVLFAYALSRRLAERSIPVNALHPGFVGTRIANKGGLVDLAWALVKPFIMSEEQGAQTTLFAALAPEMATVTGQYLVAKKPVRSNPISYDVATQERLWQWSAEKVGIGT